MCDFPLRLDHAYPDWLADGGTRARDGVLMVALPDIVPWGFSLALDGLAGRVTS